MIGFGMAGLLVVAGCNGSDDSASETPGGRATTIAPTDDGGSSGDGGVGAAATSMIDVSLTEMVINGDLTAPAGNVVLDVTNVGAEEHNLIRRDPFLRTLKLAPGETAAMDLGVLVPGTYEFYCDISGHQSAGMVATRGEGR